MSEVRGEEVKNIGDAGDSTRDEVDEDLSNPVSEVVARIKRVLQCGDHQGLKISLGLLEQWKRSGQTSQTHDYWRAAQHIGETELNNVCLLLTVTFDKPESIRWCFMGDVLRLLSLTLCNRETIFHLLAHTNSVVPILVEAIQQQVQDDARLHALNIINLTTTVCRARFANALINVHFLDKLVYSFNCPGPDIQETLLEKTLEIIKSLLMCGQTSIYNYAIEVLNKMSPVMQRQAGQTQLSGFYHELLRSTKISDKAHLCSKYWTKGKLNKDLLSQCLGQPWLHIYCSWHACGNHNATPNTFFRKCSTCSSVRYCSKQCQEKHWWAGHKAQCKVTSHPVLTS